MRLRCINKTKLWTIVINNLFYEPNSGIDGSNGCVTLNQSVFIWWNISGQPLWLAANTEVARLRFTLGYVN